MRAGVWMWSIACQYAGTLETRHRAPVAQMLRQTCYSIKSLPFTNAVLRRHAGACQMRPRCYTTGLLRSTAPAEMTIHSKYHLYCNKNFPLKGMREAAL
eukprot:1159933-Pelagomonas_calceolata.AAC.4